MFRHLNQRTGHYALLLAVGVSLTLPNLGAPSLWDIDEGNNAEAAREMLDSGNWVVPTFNFNLRTDKPALLYWLQIAGYRVFGVNEFSARLPSALAALAAVLVVYELGWRLFAPSTALLAGLMLAANGSFCAAAHFANPDALLHLWTALAFLCFWQGYARGHGWWFVPFGMATGLGMLAKGPVALVLPATVVVLFLLWTKRLHLLFDRRQLLGCLVFGLIALPWYAWVGADTKGEFLRGFFLTHNLDRSLKPMEQHSGPVYYYLLVLAVGFAPWSLFLGLTAWYGSGRRARADTVLQAAASPALPAAHADAYRFLWCWAAVYLVFFTVVRTKLPNYILPLYPAAALLTARFFDRWRCGTVRPPAWTLHLGLALLVLLGIGTVLGLLTVGGVVELPALRGRVYPEVRPFAVLGLLPVAAATAAWWCLRRARRTVLLGVVAGMAVVFFGCLAAWGGAALNAAKAPQLLAAALPADQEQREVRFGTHQYFQPSLVFYCRREVHDLARPYDVALFLHRPQPAYLFVRADVWEIVEPQILVPHRVVARHRDLYRNCEVLVITNE